MVLSLALMTREVALVLAATGLFFVALYLIKMARRLVTPRAERPTGSPYVLPRRARRKTRKPELTVV